jgi:Ran GTPase-activating protein 1
MVFVLKMAFIHLQHGSFSFSFRVVIKGGQGWPIRVFQVDAMGNSLNKSAKQSEPAASQSTEQKKCSGCKCKKASSVSEVSIPESPVIVVEDIAQEEVPLGETEAVVDDVVVVPTTVNAEKESPAEDVVVVIPTEGVKQVSEGEAVVLPEPREEFKAEKVAPIEPVYEYSIVNQKLKLTTAEDVAEHVEFIKSHPELKVLLFSGNTIGVEAAKSLAEAISKLDNLVEFDLHDCFTGRMKEEVHVAVEAFNKVLKTKSTLRKVDFSDNAFGPVGARAMAILLSEAASLEELILNNNGLGPQGGNIIAQALIDLQKLNIEAGRVSKLHRVEIGRNRLENGSAPLFSEAFKAHGSLEEIALPQCGIRPEGISELSKGIAANPNLVKVNLQDNTFTTIGSVDFAKALEGLPKLEVLNIGDCLLGGDGCIKIIEALVASDSPLRSLNLQYNEMNECGVKLLIQSIDKFTTLKVLMLNGNCFNPIGETAAALKDALRKMERTDILDSWSDMEYYSDEDDSDLDPEKEMECKVQDSESEKEVDLAAELSKMDIATKD